MAKKIEKDKKLRREYALRNATEGDE